MRRHCRAVFFFIVGLAAVASSSLPASAKVDQVSERGFVVRLTSDVPASPDEVWAELVKPSDWWDAEHSYSGDAANFWLEPRPGGCFCETLPGEGADATPKGGVEHMRVIYAERPRALRLVGSLGPLQSEALVGTLTMQAKPIPGGGTRLMWEYVVGGYMRMPVDSISAAVDKVLAGQLGRLSAKLGRTEPPAAETSPAGKTEIIGR